MKKTFPVIFTLITLSIAGILFIQVTWVQGLMILARNQVTDKVNQAAVNVSNEVSKKMNSGISFRFPKSAQGLNEDFHIHSFNDPSVANIYNEKELGESVQLALNKHGLANLKYEFALADKTGVIRLRSKQFYDVYTDTSLNTLQVRVSIIPQDIIEPVGPFETIIIIVPKVRSYILHDLQWIILGAILFIFIVLAAFFITVRSLVTQKKLNEIKRDFINNMTHELKTPLATISLAVDALKSPKVQTDTKSMNYFSNIIKEENERMNKHVEVILQAAQLEKKEYVLNKQPVDVHDLLFGVLDSFKLQLDAKPSTIHTNFDADPSVIEVDEEYLLHVFSNLIDNAIKYSKAFIDITVSTLSLPAEIQIIIEDKGIGMDATSTKNIFEKFYRAHTGNIHDVKGFGLGMSYVKWVIDIHKGKIKVVSELDKGTKMIITLPVVYPK
jgi:two-component system phosphate regulon sensor histidine kinase PhoR